MSKAFYVAVAKHLARTYKREVSATTDGLVYLEDGRHFMLSDWASRLVAMPMFVADDEPGRYGGFSLHCGTWRFDLRNHRPHTQPAAVAEAVDFFLRTTSPEWRRGYWELELADWRRRHARVTFGNAPRPTRKAKGA